MVLAIIHTYLHGMKLYMSTYSTSIFFLIDDIIVIRSIITPTHEYI